MEVRFIIPGPPIPYRRVSDRRGGGKAVPKRQRDYRRWLADFAWAEMGRLGIGQPLQGALEVRFEVFAKNWKLGDGSNYQKLCEDAFNSVVWVDDIQVVDWSGSRHVDTKRPRVVITVRQLDVGEDMRLPPSARRAA
jgi:Holliday junction resolvase RusA-like endonuclease